jgi:SAM-dependent methyltransferase
MSLLMAEIGLGIALRMTCPICEHNQFWRIAAAQDPQADAVRAQYGDNAPVDWRLCKLCGNAYPSRPPDRRILQALWASNRTDETASPAEKAKFWAHRRYIAAIGGKRSYRIFAPLMKAAGSFLDIGCGLGEAVRTFASHGWDAEGIDADQSTAPVHREIGIRARIGQLEDFEVDRTYDLIHCAHAIYFITDPMRFLRMVRERLAPAGIFCIVISDFLANFDRSLPGYVHTFFPTDSSMRFALALAGFDTVLSKRMAGSIYIAARPTPNPLRPVPSPVGIRMLYQTKTLRYVLLGWPYLLFRRIVKTLLGRLSKPAFSR